MTTERAGRNTDRELWRESLGDYYANSIHVTESGGIGINVGGRVIVKTLSEWHRLASTPTERAQIGAVVLRAPEVDKVLDDLRQAIEEGTGHLALESERIIRLMRAEHRRLWQLANFPSGERAQIVSWLDDLADIFSRGANCDDHEWCRALRYAANAIKRGKHLSEPPTGEAE